MGQKSSSISPNSCQQRTLCLTAGYARKSLSIPLDLIQLISQFYRNKSSQLIVNEYMYKHDICRISDSTCCIMTAVEYSKLKKSERMYVDDQIRIITSLDHCHILQIYDVYFHETSAALLIMHGCAKGMYIMNAFSFVIHPNSLLLYDLTISQQCHWNI